MSKELNLNERFDLLMEMKGILEKIEKFETSEIPILNSDNLINELKTYEVALLVYFVRESFKNKNIINQVVEYQKENNVTQERKAENIASYLCGLDQFIGKLNELYDLLKKYFDGKNGRNAIKKFKTE